MFTTSTLPALMPTNDRKRILQTSTLMVMATAMAVVSWPYALALQNPTNQEKGNLTGTELLHYLMEENPKQVCKYIKCLSPLQVGECPHGSHYMKSVAQLGCCDACVQFMDEDEDEEKCCGGVDPLYAEFEGFCSAIDQTSTCTREPGGEIVTPSSPRTNAKLVHSSNVLKSTRCDYGLCCSRSGRCSANPQLSTCESIRETHDKFLLMPDYKKIRDDYLWWPECSSDGKFAPKQCKGPQGERKRCVCVDPNGNTIYGSAYEWQKDLYEDMNCACSRRRWELQQAGELVVTLHCKENGNYEELQCEKGFCYCLDPKTNKPYGKRLPEPIMKFLPCYNKTMIGEQYLRRCESAHVAHMEALEYLYDHGVTGPDSVINCDPDGSYGGVLKEKSSLYYCVDKYGQNPTPTQDGSGCGCIRDKILLAEADYLTLECETGKGIYKEQQVTERTAFCVDQDGVRAGPQVLPEYVEYLSCKTAVECQMAGDTSDASYYCANACSDCKDEYYVDYNQES